MRAKVPLFAETHPLVSGGALVVDWPSFVGGRLLVAHGFGIIVAWGCGAPAPSLAP